MRRASTAAAAPYRRAMPGSQEEARAVAERGEMRLHLADYWLGRARLQRDLGRKDRFEAALAEAARSIRNTGYLRRDKELQQLRP